MRRLFIFFLFTSVATYGQSLSNLRTKFISTVPDTVVMDTLSIAPGTFYMISGNEYIDTSAYNFDFVHAQIIWKKNSPAFASIKNDSVKVNYRVFSFLFSKVYRNKNTDLLSKGLTSAPLFYNPGPDQPEIFKTQGLSRNGSISRGITFGNNQDVFVNSSLNLQLAGKLSDNVEILAAITDENIPVQPEGNTQQLQDFDKVFIQLSNNSNKLIAGDFELKRPDSYFMNFYKKGQGGYFTTVIPLNKDQEKKKQVLRSGISLAVSKGKFSRNKIDVKEGNQGPYRLIGANGETYIVILSGTEKIYLNGLQLIRGSQNDYVIDYNTAELTFTPRILITKDTRIVAEFEYSDKNYARTLLYLNNEYETDKLKVKFNLYSEQDSKNQPLNLTLDSTKQEVMASVGDSIQNAIYPTADSVQINENAVLYLKKDTTVAGGTYSIYYYAGKNDSAYWQVSFSDVGAGHGNYVQDITSTNGRVFKWLEPLGGIPQGNFEPVGLLITPKKQQLITTGIDYSIDKNNSLSVEGAYSNNDINRFSSKDKYNDAGFATRLVFRNSISLSKDSVRGWSLSNALNYEFTGKYFKPIERYRNVEFERDWNLGTAASAVENEHISAVQTTLVKPSLLTLTYQLKSFNKGVFYDGLMNSANGNLKLEKFTLLAAGSFLNSKSIDNRTNFLRHYADLSRPLWKVVVGMRENAEENQIKTSGDDTLLLQSAKFQELQGYVNTLDTAKSKASLSYKQRTDDAPANNAFRQATKAEELNFTMEFTKNPDHTFRTTTTYRTLEIKDSALTQQEAAKTIVNRIDHTLNLWNGFLSFNTFYEVGSGQERKLEYYYLRVNDGQGVYAYVGDENGNGVQDLNEFAIAAFQNEANFIRVYIPTNDFITTRNNQFNEVFVITPGGNHGSVQGTEPFINSFSNQLSVRLDRKTQGESLLSSLNPFYQDVNDTSLISSASNVRNTVYYNKRSPVYGLDFTLQEVKNKAFLTSGFETRVQRSQLLNIRWNVNRAFLLSLALEQGQKINKSDYFSTRDYSIHSNSTEPKVSYQPGTNFRITTSYQYSDKKNITGSLNERAISNKFQMEMKYTAALSGNISAKVALININYNAADDSYLAYDMLEGFKNGKNITWGAAIDRTLNNSIQLSLTYDGRKLQDSPIVHTGGVQVRAFF
jgi:hypothetical protein